MTPHTPTPPRPDLGMLGDPHAQYRPRYTDTTQHHVNLVHCACGWTGGEQRAAGGRP